jgi:hypothetical protein
MRSCLGGLGDSWFGSAGVKSGLQLGFWPGGNGIDGVSAEEGSALACGDGVLVAPRW